MGLVRGGSRFFFSFLIAATLAACGGGGGSPSSDQGVGRVGILLTDGPIDNIEQVNVTITRVELLGNSAPVTLFEGDETIDLLDLEMFSDLFAVSDTVPAGDYDKIRLRVSGIELIDDNGDTHIADVPANGKIDLNPRGSFTVVSGETLMLEVDIDAEKSIHIVQTGNGKYKFRPVVFIKVISAVDNGKLVRISGVARAAPENGSFELCTSLNPDVGCIKVTLDDNTGVFGENGDPADASAIIAEQALTAIGHFEYSDNMTTDGMLHLSAAVIELGTPGTFRTLDGLINSVPASETDSFGFDIAPNQGFADPTSVSVLLQTGTRIFSKAGEPLDYTAITTGREASIDGVLMLSGTAPDVLKSSLIIIDDPDAATMLSGTLSVIENGEMTIATASGDRCVRLASGATILEVDGNSNSSMEVDLIDLTASGQDIEVYGSEGTECFIAETVLVFI